MRNTILVLLLFIAVSCSNQNSEVECFGSFAKYKGIDTNSTVIIDTYQIDLDFDGVEDQIVLENLKDLVGDPQLFTIVKIRMGDGKVYVFKDIGGYYLDKSVAVKYPNRIESNKLYIPSLSQRESGIFIWDFTYPDGTSNFQFLRIWKGHAGLTSDNMIVTKIEDLNQDNIVDVEGYSINENDRIIIQILSD